MRPFGVEEYSDRLIHINMFDEIDLFLRGDYFRSIDIGFFQKFKRMFVVSKTNGHILIFVAC